MALGVAWSGNDEKVVRDLDGFEAIDDDFGGGLGVQFVAVNHSLGAEMEGEALGVGDVVGMRQEDPRQAAPLLDAAHESRQELRRIDEPIAVGPADEVAIAAERLRRVHAAVIDVVFDRQREIVEHRAGGVSSMSADGAGRTADEGLEGAVRLLRVGGLELHEGITVGFAEDFGRDLPAGIAINAGRIDEELAGYVLADDFAWVCHGQCPSGLMNTEATA